MLQGVGRLQELLAGRYEIEREVGRGGMATVYLARDVRHGRHVALKVLKPEFAAGLGSDRFRAEIEIAGGLAHPGILPVFDSGGVGDELFYVMPFIEGESLRNRLARTGRLSLREAVRIACDVGEALGYAHARDIVHRDVKPENILLVEGRAVIADFGIARAIAHATTADRLTLPGVALGTPLYMSPEQASGDQNVDGRSDVYSLACVLFEMLAGVAPHVASTPREILQRKLTPESFPPVPSRLNAPAEVTRALERALSSDPAQRFRTAHQFVAAIAASPGPLRRSSGWVAERVVSLGQERWWRRVALATAVSAVAIIVTLSWRLTHPALLGRDGRIALAVLPFRSTVPAAAQWAEAVPDLLATAIDGTPGVRVVDPWGLWRLLRPTADAAPRSPDPREGARLAERANACCFVLGSIAELNHQVEVTLRLYRRGDDDPWHTLSETAPVDSIAGMVQRLAVQVIRRLTDSATAGAFTGLDRSLTRSPLAMKSWLHARELRRRGQIDSADAAITYALSADSMFLLALVDAVSIRSWAQFQRGEPYTGLFQLAERAVRLSDSVPERARLRVDAMLASLQTDGPRAVRSLDRLLALDSADVDAWSMLSYIHMVYGWQYGRSERDAIRAAEAALRLDSTDATALVRRSSLASGVNDEQDLGRQLRRLRGADTTTPLVRAELRAIEAVRASDAEFPAIAERLTQAPVAIWFTASRVLRIYRPDRAETLARRALATGSLDGQRAGLGGLVQLWSAEGRWSAVDSLERASAFVATPGFDRVVHRLAAAASIAGAGDEQRGWRAAATLAATMIPDSAQAWRQTRPVWLEGWLIGAFHAMYGDTTLAWQWQAALGALPRGGSPERYGEALQADLRARLASRRGDRRSAFAEAERALALWSIHTNVQSELMPEPAMRFHLATLLQASGRPDSAAALFRSLVPPTTWMGFYTARAALELGDIAEARGDRAAALRYYLTASRLWERGDRGVAAYHQRARRGAERQTS
jgi:hypothetical protein